MCAPRENNFDVDSFKEFKRSHIAEEKVESGRENKLDEMEYL